MMNPDIIQWRKVIFTPTHAKVVDDTASSLNHSKLKVNKTVRRITGIL
jgi:hypothetical protein